MPFNYNISNVSTMSNELLKPLIFYYYSGSLTYNTCDSGYLRILLT